MTSYFPRGEFLRPSNHSLHTVWMYGILIPSAHGGEFYFLSCVNNNHRKQQLFTKHLLLPIPSENMIFVDCNLIATRVALYMSIPNVVTFHWDSYCVGDVK